MFCAQCAPPGLLATLQGLAGSCHYSIGNLTTMLWETCTTTKKIMIIINVNQEGERVALLVVFLSLCMALESLSAYLD